MATIPPNEGDTTARSTLAMIERTKPLDTRDVTVADCDARLHQALQILARSLLRQAQRQLEQPRDSDGSCEADGGADLEQNEPLA